MCSSSKKQNHFKTAAIWFAAMGLGAVLGHLSIDFINELCQFIATAFTRLFQFLAIPVISLAVIATLSQLGAKVESRRIFSRTLFYTLTTTFADEETARLQFEQIGIENDDSIVCAHSGDTIYIAESFQATLDEVRQWLVRFDLELRKPLFIREE